MKEERKMHETYVPRHLKKENTVLKEEPIRKKPFRIKRIVFVLLTVPLVFLLPFQLKNNGLEAYRSDTMQTAYDPMPVEYRSTWTKHKAINPDYVGEIVFDSGLICLPFVQAKDVYDSNDDPYLFYTPEGDIVDDVDSYCGNDVYIWKNWKTGDYDRYEEGGSVFMDYRNSLDDQNLIIYGHHFARDYDPSGSKQFTPLDILLEKENYETNSSLKLILEDEIRNYEICAVLIIDATDEKQLQIARTDLNYDLSGNHDPDYYENYLELIRNHSAYDTGIQIEPYDKLLTLFTCIEHRPDFRQAIICKEIHREIYGKKKGTLGA